MAKAKYHWEGVEYGSAEYHRLWRLANNEHSREYHREYDKKMYKEKLERESARRRRYIEKYPDRFKANQKVYRAIKSGKLIKQPCLYCGVDKVVAHHKDYSKPLEVLWLCQYHHKLEHNRDKIEQGQYCATQRKLSKDGLVLMNQGV